MYIPEIQSEESIAANGDNSLLKDWKGLQALGFDESTGEIWNDALSPLGSMEKLDQKIAYILSKTRYPYF